MKFGRIPVRIAELRSNFKARARISGSSSVGMATRVEFIIDWWRVAAYRGTGIPRRFNGVLAPSSRRVGFRPVDFFLAPIWWISLGEGRRTRARRFRRSPRNRGSLRSNGYPA